MNESSPDWEAMEKNIDYLIENYSSAITMKYRLELNEKQYATFLRVIKDDELIQEEHKLLLNRDIDEGIMTFLSFCKPL